MNRYRAQCRHRGRRQQTRFSLGLALLALLCACSDARPIRIGFLGGLSGRVADLGISGRDGALLAVEQRNARGGVNGRKVQLLVRDDAQDAATARDAAGALIDAGVPAIIGPMTSSVAMAVVPLVDASRSVLVSPTVTTHELSGRDDRFLRVSATTRDYARKTARYLATGQGAATATLVFDLSNAAYTRSWMEHFKAEYVRLGGTVNSEVTFTSGNDVVFLDLARRATETAPEAVVISAGAMDAAMLCQQFAKLNKQLLIAVSEWAATERFLEFGGTAIEGVVVDQFFDRNSTAPSYLAFREAHRARFSTEPGFVSVGAYDATNLVMDALAAQRDGEDLKQTLLRLRTLDGVQGRITLDASGDSDRQTHLSVVRGGAFQPLE